MHIESLAVRLIEEATNLHASDIHIVQRRMETTIHFRLHGDLVFQQELAKETSERLIAHFKFLADMDIGERRKPQGGSMELTVANSHIHLRLSTLPTMFSESLVIRLLPQSTKLPMSHLSLFSSTTTKLLSLLHYSHGLIIHTGPTGSGKSTTLYTLLHSCRNELGRNVITIEDPVEKRTEDFLQVQVNEKAGITYASGLKAILRHDPDVVMIGEIRDEETARIAVRAALTGHLIFSTMHTKNAEGAIYRLLEFGISMQEIEQTLIATTAQRLVKILCPNCGESCSCGNKKRAGVYELLYGTHLQIAIENAKGNQHKNSYTTLQSVIRKGVALGFLSDQLLKQWVMDDEA